MLLHLRINLQICVTKKKNTKMYTIRISTTHVGWNVLLYMYRKIISFDIQNRKWIKVSVAIVSYFFSLYLQYYDDYYYLVFIFYFILFSFILCNVQLLVTCDVDTRPYVSFKCFLFIAMSMDAFLFFLLPFFYCCLVHLCYLLPRAVCFWVFFFPLEKRPSKILNAWKSSKYSR